MFGYRTANQSALILILLLLRIDEIEVGKQETGKRFACSYTHTSKRRWNTHTRLRRPPPVHLAGGRGKPQAPSMTSIASPACLANGRGQPNRRRRLRRPQLASPVAAASPSRRAAKLRQPYGREPQLRRHMRAGALPPSRMPSAAVAWSFEPGG